MLYLTPGLSAWILALAYQQGQETVCDFFFFYEWTGRFFPPSVSTRIEFHFIEKNKGEKGGMCGGRAGRRRQGVSGDLRPPAAGPQPRLKPKSLTEMYIC